MTRDEYLQTQTGYISRRILMEYIIDNKVDGFGAETPDSIFIRNDLVDKWGNDIELYIPNEDVSPIVHGHWIRPIIAQERSYKWQCSVCGQIACCVFNGGKRSKKAVCKFAYCPNCGAKMDGEETNRLPLSVIGIKNCDFSDTPSSTQLSITAKSTDKAAESLKVLGVTVLDTSENMKPLSQIFEELRGLMEQLSINEEGGENNEM